MSHKATNWLASLDAQGVGASEFRVLFHLCDCHNPSQGCFPTQGYLMDVTGVSNGTLNNALNALEGKGLIRRHRTFDGKTKRQKPTRYTLGFEMQKQADPTPISGDGTASESDPDSDPDPTPISGDGADSNSDPDPTPISGQSRLQPTGEEPVKEPVINQRVRGMAAEFGENTVASARFWANAIRSGKHVPQTAISAQVERCILAGKMITDDEAMRVGLKR